MCPHNPSAVNLCFSQTRANRSLHNQPKKVRIDRLKLSRNSLYDFELSRPGAPSLDPRFRTTNGQNHQLFINQIVPIVVLVWPMPSAKHSVYIGLEIERKFLLPDAEIFSHDILRL